MGSDKMLTRRPIKLFLKKRYVLNVAKGCIFNSNLAVFPVFNRFCVSPIPAVTSPSYNTEMRLKRCQMVFEHSNNNQTRM